MSSFTRRMQRAAGRPMRNYSSGIPHFGTKLGVTNPVKTLKRTPRGSRRATKKSTWRSGL